MCEFCTEHGEGKKWYLQMKNYSKELLAEDLSASKRDTIGVANRYEWTNRFWENFVMPAITSVPGLPPDKLFSSTSVDGRKVEHFGQVLPIEDVEKVIDMVDSITRMPCGCRFLTTGKTDKRYCFGLGLDKWGTLGKFPDAASSLEVLDKEEAKKIFRQYDKEGLMHSIWTGVTPYLIGLCNCDCDCGAYKKYIRMRGAPTFFRAEYICKIDSDLCTGCKSCIKQCQFGAEFYSSASGKVYIDPTRCFGCGVCRTVCPKNAIELIPRQESPEAADLWLKDRSGG
ncbi:MAG: ATP-binding protein [Planctomycetota bacterium]|jgi:NAD-dependent dihydropyrimidine dehydrogenase PreA subunit